MSALVCLGLLGGFILSADRRGLLAILAVSVSVGYALVAGAATAGVEQAQDVLSPDLQDQVFLAVRPQLAPIRPDQVPLRPDSTLAVTEAGGRTYYTLRNGAQPSPDGLVAGNATGLRSGQPVNVAGETQLVLGRTPAQGAAADWIGVNESTFRRLGGIAAPDFHVAVYARELDADDQAQFAPLGLSLVQAPAAIPFFTQGADDLIQGVAVTVLASTVVVGIITQSFVTMEIQARRRSYATLRLYGGPGLVQRIVAARGLVLLAAGHVLAITVVVGLLFLLRRAEAAPLAFQPSWTGLTLAATFVGGLLGLVPPLLRSRERLRARELAERTPKRRPQWMRPILASWRNVVPLAVSALVLIASLAVLLGAVGIPNQIFGSGDTDVIAAPSGNPLRGRISSFLGENLHRLEDYRAASPEVFAPTVYQGNPLLVRGVNWSLLVALDEPKLLRGEPPLRLGEAVVGERASRILGIELDEQLVVPGSYGRSVHVLTVVGVARAPGILDDEVFVSLDTARAMTDLPPANVNLVRVRAIPPPGQPIAAGPRIPDQIEVAELRLEPDQPVPFEETVLSAQAINFGPASTRRLILHVNEIPVMDRWVALPANAQSTMTFRFRVPAEGIHEIRVNPTLEPGTTPPAYRLDVPSTTVAGRSLSVTVLDYEDRPVSGASLQLDASTATSDASGTATLVATTHGNRTLLVNGPAGRAARPVLVLDPSDENRPRLQVLQLDGAPAQAQTSWNGAAVVENVGNRTFVGRLTVEVNGEERPTTPMRLGPGARERVPFGLTLAFGNHTVRAQGLQVNVSIQPDVASTDLSKLTIDQLFQLRAERLANTVEDRNDATTAFLGETYENLNAALVVVVLATVLHSALIALVAIQRETEERAEIVGTLAALGADPPALRRRALRDNFLIALSAALIGASLALGLTRLAAETGLLAGFGHSLLPRTDLEFMARVIAVSIATSLASAALAVHVVRGRTDTPQLVQGPRRAERPSLERLLEGRP